jgi:predicted PP-loop superfamily ATPase
MKVKDLIEQLQRFNEDMEIMISDNHGFLRTLNKHPRESLVYQQDADMCGDCEDLVEQTVVQIGFGSY